MKKLILLLLSLLCLGTAAAEETFTEGMFEYTLTEEGAVITKYLCPDIAPEIVEIPAFIGGQPVIDMGYVFSGSWPGEIRQVIVAEGITTIGNAFVECADIAEIVLPASLTDIREDAFSWGDAEIILHPDNPHFINEDGFLIDTRTNTLLYTAPSAADKPLPAVHRLGDHCLWNWHPGEHVELPETLTSIGAGVCAEWLDTTSISIPDSVTDIGAGAFNCAGLTSIDLPDGLTSIPDLMLSCTYITEIMIPESVTSIGGWAFYLCPLTRVEIPASCTFVAWDAFDPEVELVCLGNNTHIETWEERWGEEDSTP